MRKLQWKMKWRVFYEPRRIYIRHLRAHVCVLGRDEYLSVPASLVRADGRREHDTRRWRVQFAVLRSVSRSSQQRTRSHSCPNLRRQSAYLDRRCHTTKMRSTLLPFLATKSNVASTLLLVWTGFYTCLLYSPKLLHHYKFLQIKQSDFGHSCMSVKTNVDSSMDVFNTQR